MVSWGMLSGGQARGWQSPFARWNTGPRVLKAGGLAPSRRFNANEIAAVAACPLLPAAALEGGFSGTLDAGGIDQSQRGLRVGI